MLDKWNQKNLAKIKIKPSDNQQPNATCYSCGKTLSGKWSMESNSSNTSYFNTTTGRYLFISDGFFYIEVVLIGYILIANLVG